MKKEQPIFSPEEMIKIEKERAKSDAGLVEGGARYENLSGAEVLQLKPWQMDKVRGEMRQDMEKKLAELPPLFKEDKDEYKQIDPEGLFVEWYEENKKTEGEPAFFKDIEPARSQYKYWGETRGLKEINIGVAYAISRYAHSTALASVYFENNREKAKKIIERAFAILNNSVFKKPYSNLWEERDRGCVCSFAESLGYTANMLGFPDLADRFGKSTLCPTSPQYRDNESAYGVHSQGEDRSIEKIQRDIKKEVTREIMGLQYRKEKQEKKE